MCVKRLNGPRFNFGWRLGDARHIEPKTLCQTGDVILYGDGSSMRLPPNYFNLLLIVQSAIHYLPTWPMRAVIAVCLICCTPSCAGLMFHNDCSTNSAPPFTGVCRTKHLNIWWTAALLSQTLPVVNICDQPVATSCSCHDTDVRCSAVGPSLLLVRRSGTRCQTVYETRHVLSTAFGLISRLYFS